MQKLLGFLLPYFWHTGRSKSLPHFCVCQPLLLLIWPTDLWFWRGLQTSEWAGNEKSLASIYGFAGKIHSFTWPLLWLYNIGQKKFNFIMTCEDNLPVLSLPFQISIASYKSVFYTIHFLNESAFPGRFKWRLSLFDIVLFAWWFEPLVTEHHPSSWFYNRTCLRHFVTILELSSCRVIKICRHRRIWLK